MSSFPLFLMRHGEPEQAGRLLGHSDVPATESGVRACLAQAEELRVERLIASDLRRASACAAAIGEPMLDPRWRELDFGAWDGLSSSEVDPADLSRFWGDPDGNPPPGGERWSALVARVSAAIAALAPVPTLVVTHGGPMRAALATLCGFDVGRTWSFELPCASVLALNVWPGQPRTAQIAGLWP